MKKLISLFTALGLATITTTNVIACTTTPQIKGYNSIEEGIQSLQLNSYLPVNSEIDNVKQILILDIINNLLKLKFADNVNMKMFLLSLFKETVLIEDVIVFKSDNTLLTDDDFITTQTLKVYAICELNQNLIHLNNPITINIIENKKTDQEVVADILQYDFTNLLANNNLPLFAGILQNFFNEKLIIYLLRIVGGSYFLSNLNLTKLSINSIHNADTDTEITQNDLSQAGNLKLKINFKYGDIENQNLNFTINLTKFDFNNFNFSKNLGENDYEVTNPKSLDKEEVNDIVGELKEILRDKIKTWFQNSEIFSIPEEDLQNLGFRGIEKIIYTGADLSLQKIVVFDVVAHQNSKILTGTLKNFVFFVKAHD